MEGKLMKRPSPALVVAMVALFVALGGTAGAVVTAAVPLREAGVGLRQLEEAERVHGEPGRIGAPSRWPSRSRLRARGRRRPPRVS
jgi:hypothetical protein